MFAMLGVNPMEFIILIAFALSIGVVLGLPVGIWTLCLLRRQEVEDEFRRAEQLAKNHEAD